LAALIGWTRQVPQVWEEIEQTGNYKVKEEYIRIKNDTIADFYLKLYEWYTQKSRAYVDIPEDAKYPIWFSLSEDFRLQKVPGTVTMRVEIPEENVLVIDMEKWDYRGNLMYVAIDQKDRDNFERELARYGIGDETALAESAKGNYYPLLKKKVIDSWERVFTMPPALLEKGFATTWEIKKEWVKEVVSNDE
jgi:galactokinase/mevalonate kinase-like predicted kinase